MRIKPTLILAAIVASLGGLLFGFDTAVISGTTGWLQDYFDLSKFTLGVAVFCTKPINTPSAIMAIMTNLIILFLLSISCTQI